MKAVQYFSDEYLAHCRRMKPGQIAAFLEDFRKLHGARAAQSSQLISLRIPKPLLAAFKAKASLTGTPYQSMIKRLMEAWLASE